MFTYVDFTAVILSIFRSPTLDLHLSLNRDVTFLYLHTADRQCYYNIYFLYTDYSTSYM